MCSRITGHLLVLGCFRGQFHSYNSADRDLPGESILYFPLRVTGRSRSARLLGEGGTMSGEASIFRLYLLRLFVLLNFVLLRLDVWPAIINHKGAWDPMRGVALSFWASLSALSGLGLRYPVKMVPLLLLQFFLSRFG
jgi:hypothetical protein